MERYQVYPPDTDEWAEGINFKDEDYKNSRHITHWRVEDSTDHKKVWYFDTEDEARAKAAEMNRDG